MSHLSNNNSSILPQLLYEYSKFSLETLATKTLSAPYKVYKQQNQHVVKSSNHKINVTQNEPNSWRKLMESLSKTRKAELQALAETKINEWKGRNFNKNKLVNNVKHTLYDYDYKPSLTDKFFILWAANGDKFAFKFSKWVFYARFNMFDPLADRITTINELGNIISTPVSESIDPCENTFVCANPWIPLKAKSSYKKEQLVNIAKDIGIDFTGSLDAIYQRLIPSIHSLPLTN